MNKKSLLTRAHITLARSARARQTIAAVLMLFAVPSAWAVSNVDFYYLDGEWFIKSQLGWEEFCDCINKGQHDGLRGYVVKLYDDVTATTMVGSSPENCFKGTFDGRGHTITVNYGSSQERSTDQNVALFRYTNGDVTIKNLHVNGSIYTNAKYAAGFIAQGEGSSIVISNCLSSVTIDSSVNGDGTHAGFVAISDVSSSTSFEGCRFDGRFLGSNTSCWGGFVGWRANGSVSIQGSIFNPSELNVSDSGSASFCRNLRKGTDPVVCSHSTGSPLGEDQSSQDRTIMEGNKATVSLCGDATYYNMTGITLYSTADSILGMKYGSICYSSILNGDIDINLGLANVPSGYMLKKYNVSNGKLYRSGNPFTLVPTGDDDVIIHAETVASPWSGNGTDDSPCLITSEQDLITLSDNVYNGNTYECVLFQQSADITCTKEFKPIGTNGRPFMGRYDGNGKKISNCNVTGNYSYMGLFGIIEGRDERNEAHNYHPQLFDITIENSSVTIPIDNSFAGMLVGFVGEYGQVLNCTVENCTVQCPGEGYGTLGGLAGFAFGADNAWIKGNRVIGTKVLNGSACGGLLGGAALKFDICDNFADATVHARLRNNRYCEAAFIGYFNNAYSSSSKENHNFYHSSDNLPAACDDSDSDFAKPLYVINDVPEGVEVNGTAAITYNGTNYYAGGTDVTLSAYSKSVLSISGAADYTISEDKHSATITFGTSDVTVDIQTIIGTCGENATWVLDKDDQGKYTCLTISGSGAIDNYDHTTDGTTTTWRTTAPWGWDLTSITIGDEITSIGDYAFIGCQQLSELSLGKGVTSIGTNAFDHCDGLTVVTLPANVSTLSAGAFKNSVNLQRVNIQKSDGLVSITGGSAFDGCHSSLVLVPPTPALALQYKTAENWSAYASKLRAAFGNYLFTATDEGGTAAYAIANAADLNNLSAAVNEHSDYSGGHNFRQTADITLSGTFTPIGIDYGHPFYDNYDGGGYIISGLNINTNSKYAGLFGYASHGVAHDYTFDDLIIKNVTLVSPVVISNSNDANVGALVAMTFRCKIQNCVAINPTVSATGSGSNRVGAIVGDSDSSFTYYRNIHFYDSDASHDYPVIGYYVNAAEYTNVGRARKVTFSDDITAIPDATDIASGFVYKSESYYREGLELTLNAPEGYDAEFSYTEGSTTTELQGSTLTVPAADISVNLVNLSIKKWAGSGTSEDPFMIEYVSQLDSLAQRVNGGTDFAGIYFKLGKDICYDTKGLADTESNFTAIGGHKKYFKGHFEGDNHKVSGIRIYKDGTDFEDFYQGLFGQIGPGASVSGVFLSDARITGYQRVGGIVGENQGGTVSNCHVLSDVTIHAVKNMSTYHGGNVGSNSQGGIVTNCTGAATVTYADGLSYCQYYGGIVGQNNNATVTNCLYTGTTVSANAYVGAIIGLNSGTNSKVENCYYIVEDVTGGNGDTNCAIGDLSELAPDPEHVMPIDIDDLAPDAIATRLAPLDNEDNNFFVTLMARRAATLKAAVPQYNASVNLTLKGRTLNRDGKWHTICLPFDVTLEGSVLEGAEARTLTNASITGTTLNLEFSNPVEKLVAGTPYIIRIGNTESAARAEDPAVSALKNPRFANVDIDDTDRSFDNAASGNRRVRFVGSYKMTNFDNTLKNTLLVNGTDSPYYPTAGTNVGAFRAYFTIGDGDSQGTVSITDFNIKLGDDEYTGIVGNAAERCTDRQFRKVILNAEASPAPAATEWYDLNGRKLSGKPSRSGVYIQK